MIEAIPKGIEATAEVASLSGDYPYLLGICNEAANEALCIICGLQN